MSESNPTITLLFIGICKDSDQKKAFLYHEVDLSENKGQPLKYDSTKERVYTNKGKVFASAQPGSIISVEYDAEKKTAVYPTTARLVDTWKNDDDVVKWKAAHRAKQGEIERDQAAAKKNRRDLPAEYLEPFHKAYHGCSNKRQQAQLLAWVIEQITRWPS